MSNHVSEKYCNACMFAEFGIEEDPCKGCAESLPHPKFEPALKEGDLIELAGATHKVARCEGADLYWLHRDCPAHNLQLFFDAGMSMDQVSDFFRAVDDSIMPDGSWPFIPMLQLVRCVHAIRNDCRFRVITKPVTVEDDYMPKTYNSAEELNGNVLREDDVVVFNVDGEAVWYYARKNYCTCHDGGNARVFDLLDMTDTEKNLFAEEAYGYSLPKRDGFWPYSGHGDYAALTRLCLALYEKIDPTPAVLKSADDVLKHGLKHGTKILFPGTTTEYTVEGRPEVYAAGLYLNADLGHENAFIFYELKLDKFQFCSMMYGYEHKGGDWPETAGEDYPALTRAVICLMHLAEARETAEVKSLRAKLAELVAQRESYEEDVQAAKQALNEAVEVVSQARADLSYEECELESLQEDIDELEEELEEALEGK